MDRNSEFMTEAERAAFSETLHSEKEAPVEGGQSQGTDASLVASVMRLHAMRLLYRFDERHHPQEPPEGDSAYHRAIHKFRAALRDAELSMNEARVDAAIANAHQILGNLNSNRRWLQDALAQLQQAAQKDLRKMAEAVPPPDAPNMNVIQRVTFRVLGIRQDELARRNLNSVRQLAEFQTTQLMEMIKLLANSFEVIDDRLGVQQAMTILSRFQE